MLIKCICINFGENKKIETELTYDDIISNLKSIHGSIGGKSTLDLVSL